MFKKFTIYCYKQYHNDPEEFFWATLGTLMLIALCVCLTVLIVVAFTKNSLITSVIAGGIFIAVVVPISLVLIGKHNSAQEDQ